jgi:hypothetical protein
MLEGRLRTRLSSILGDEWICKPTLQTNLNIRPRVSSGTVLACPRPKVPAIDLGEYKAKAAKSLGDEIFGAYSEPLNPVEIRRTALDLLSLRILS